MEKWGLLLLISILVTGCETWTDELPSEKEPLFWYTQNGKITGDTLHRADVYRHDPKDSLVNYIHFEVNRIGHTITYYTSDNHAAVDGGTDLFELDSLGVIYGHSTTWFEYSRLKSTTDSINTLVDIALEKIIEHREKFNYSGGRNEPKRTVQFREPTVDE